VYHFKWITPTVWRDLATLQLRFVDPTNGRAIFWILWDQASNAFSLVNDNGVPTGRAAAPGSSDPLQTGSAILRLDATTVVPGGPTAPDVTLALPITFKSEAAGPDQREYRVEVLATDDGGRAQGFAPAGIVRVSRTAESAGPTIQGSASAVGTGTDGASVRISGSFSATPVPPLDGGSLTLTSLLDEGGGAGEMVRAGGGAPLLPLTLGARAGGKPADAIYETASGVRPAVRAELKTRDPASGVLEFSIKVDRATIPTGPALCGGSSPVTTQLRTAFTLHTGPGAPLAFDVVTPWRCRGTQLEAP
jgi:hypothetical protein